MCKMNFWCSITIICIILIAALVLSNSVDLHLTRKNHGKSQQQQQQQQQQLNDFRSEAYKAKKDIEVLENFAEFSEQHGKRLRRQAENIFDNLGDEDKFEKQQMQPNCNADICKARNCAGGLCRAENSKHSLKSSKQLNNFLGNLKLESKNMPADIFLEENQSNNNEGNGKQNDEEVDVKSLRQAPNSEQKAVTVINDRKKRLKLKSGNRNDLRWRWSLNGEKSTLKQAANLVKETPIDSGLSSCHQCSQNKDNDVNSKSCKPHKAARPVNSYDTVKFSKEPEKPEANGNFVNDFEREYHKQDQPNAVDDEDDEEEEELYHVKNLKFSPCLQRNKNNNEEFKQPAFEISKSHESVALALPRPALNDQLEVTKNNLSHEADYKLSKNEQNAAENKKYATWKWGLFKRSTPFNAMNEIKLKTSQRLMQKGFGASLPSYALAENRRDLYIDNKLRQREREIFQSNENRKYNKHFDATDDMQHNFRDTQNQQEDLAEKPLEPDLATLPLNEWSRTRYKRISDTKTRHKRDLNVFKPKSSTEAVRYKKLLKNQSLSLLPNNLERKDTEVKAVKAKIGVNKTLNAESDLKQKFSKAFTVNKGKVIEKLEKKYLTATEQDEYKTHKDNEPNLGNDNLEKAFSFEQNKTKACRFKRDGVKRSLHKSDYAKQSSDLSAYKAAASFLQPFKILKRTKRFNPSQTIDLKIYQKHHSAKALKLKKHRHGLDQTPRKVNKTRHRRAVTPKKCARSSAGNENFIENAAKMIMKKATEFGKSIVNFFRQSLKYLTFQKESPKQSNSFEASTTESTVFDDNEVLKLQQDERETSTTNLKLEDKKFKIDVTKPKNPKLRFLEDLLRQLYNSRQYLMSFQQESVTELAKQRTRRRAQPEKAQQNSNSLYRSENTVKKSSKNSLAKIRFSKKVLGKDTSAIKIPVLNLNKNLKDEQSWPQKLSNKSCFKEDIYFASDKQRSKNLKNILKTKFYESLNLSKNFDNTELKEQVVETEDSPRSLNHNLSSNQTFSYKAIENSTTMNVDRSRQKSSISFRLKNEARNTFKSLKRLKRSVGTTFEAKHRTADAVNHMNKRDYFFHYGDFYTPDNKPDASLEMPSKLHTNNDNSPKLSTNEVMPALQETSFENYYKNLNKQKFDDLKNYNPQSNKFDNLEFDNIWPQTESQNENFQQQKRFVKNLDDKSLKIRNKAVRNYKVPSKTTKLPLKVQILKDKYLKDLQNFNKNYKFKANNLNSKTNLNTSNDSLDYSEKLSLELNNEILNCKAFASLEDFIKSLPKNLTQPLLIGNLTTEKIEIDLNTLSATPEVTTPARPLIPDSTENCSSKTAEEAVNNENEEVNESSEHVTQPSDMDLEQTSEFEKSPEEEKNEKTSWELTEEDASTENNTSSPTDRDAVKLNISINAQVQGNPKDQRYCGRGSFSMGPGLFDDRLRRDLNLSPLEKIPHQFLHITSQETKDGDENDEEDLADFISGKFSSKAVKDILAAVQQDPQLQAIVPSLSPSHKLAVPSQRNFYAIRNQHNEPQLRNSEKLFAQAMSDINAIVEQQARSRLCVPLRPDLQEFYNMILQSRQQQDLVRQKRQNRTPAKKPDYSYQLHLLDPSKIEEKTKIVKKLLKQYDELTQQDQQQVAVVRDDLLKNLIVLRQLQDNEERQGNDLREKRENAWAAGDEQVLQNLQSEYSLQFLKLLKAAELYREIQND